MKKTLILFLQVVIVLIGIIMLVIMMRFPLAEGRAKDLDLFSVYADPFIVYGYVASIPFFIALYQAFKLLKLIGQNKMFSLSSVKALRIIKYCAITLSILIVLAAVYIKIFSKNTGDDPAGFIMMCIVTTFISMVVATVATVFEKMLQSAVDIKSENDLTV